MTKNNFFIKCAISVNYAKVFAAMPWPCSSLASSTARIAIEHDDDDYKLCCIFESVFVFIMQQAKL